MRVAIIGCGAAGMARVSAFVGIPDAEVLVCVDQNISKAEGMAQNFGCEYSTDWQQAIARDDIDAVMIAVATNMHAVVGIGAMEAGKHIFCEAPLARTPMEAEQMLLVSEDRGLTLAVSASHRFTLAARKAKELLDAGTIDDVLFLRGWAGQGTWGGVETWYVDPEVSGGGTMMSNGISLLDLARWFVGDFDEVIGYKDTALWPIEPVEDNAFGLFRASDTGRVASLHSSWTYWKDRLGLEIVGSEGYIRLDLDEAQVILGTKTGPLAGIEQQVFDLSSQPDHSRQIELEDFFEAIRQGRKPSSSAFDGLRAVQMAHAIYRSSEKHIAVSL